MSSNQAYLFYVFLLTGILIGLLFDIFRIFRKSFKTSDLITIIEDIVFFILSSSLITYTVFKFNNGEVRSFVLIGIISGIIIYLISFSKIFIKINVKIIEIIKSIFATFFKIICYPIKLLLKVIKKLFFKPFYFIIINARKNIKVFITNLSKSFTKRKNRHKIVEKQTN